jgi:hypothetical protein
MLTDKIYDDRKLDLNELWRKVNRRPPGTILTIPSAPEDSDAGRATKKPRRS